MEFVAIQAAHGLRITGLIERGKQAVGPLASRVYIDGGCGQIALQRSGYKVLECHTLLNRFELGTLKYFIRNI